MEYTAKYKNVVSSIIALALDKSLKDIVSDFRYSISIHQTEREYVERIKSMVQLVYSHCDPWEIKLIDLLEKSIPVLDFILNTKLPQEQTFVDPTLYLIRQEGKYLIYTSTSAQGVQTFKSDSILSCWQDAVDRYAVGGIQII